MRILIFIFLFTQSVNAANLLDSLPVQLPALNTNDLSCLEIFNSDSNEFNPEQPSSTLQEDNTYFLGLLEQITKNQNLIENASQPLSNKDERHNTKNQKHLFKCKETDNCRFKTNRYSNLKAHCSQKHRDSKFAKPLLCKEEYCVKKRKKPLTYSYKSLAHGEQCPQINDELSKVYKRDYKTKLKKSGNVNTDNIKMKKRKKNAKGNQGSFFSCPFPECGTHCDMQTNNQTVYDHLEEKHGLNKETPKNWVHGIKICHLCKYAATHVNTFKSHKNDIHHKLLIQNNRETKEKQKKRQKLDSIEDITLENITSLRENNGLKIRKANCPDIEKEPKVWEETIKLFKENYKNPYHCSEENCNRKFTLRRNLRTHLRDNHTAPKNPQETCKKCRNKKSFNSLHPNGQCLPSKLLCKIIAQRYDKRYITESEKTEFKKSRENKIAKIAFYLAAIAPLK